MFTLVAFSLPQEFHIGERQLFLTAILKGYSQQNIVQFISKYLTEISIIQQFKVVKMLVNFEYGSGENSGYCTDWQLIHRYAGLYIKKTK